MFSVNSLCRTNNLFSNITGSLLNAPDSPKILDSMKNVRVRAYAKKKDDGCRKACVDVPEPGDPSCPLPCEDRRPKKPGVLRRIRMSLVEGGTNFGTPFRRLQGKEAVCVEEKLVTPKALPAPKKLVPPVPEARPGVQVALLGAESAVGQYISLLLKQCPCISKLRLYEATQSSECNRDMYKVVQDLQHIDTNCVIQAFSCQGCELERCLQCTDIVVMLDNVAMSGDMSLEKRFEYQAPIVKRYADAISQECPRAFVIVCATPIDCMVPLIAETLKETGWYDPRKLFGSLAVPEMRASTLAARALCLEPRYTRVPCVGGTEGEALVPLFSKAVEYFDFARHNAELMTTTVRQASQAVSRTERQCKRVADLSEAHAIAGLATKVAHALLCHDIPRVSGYVETDASQVISPARFIANEVEINGSGIVKNFGLPKMNDHEVTYLSLEVLLNRHGVCKKFDIPGHLSCYEMEVMDAALTHLCRNVNLALKWKDTFFRNEFVRCQMMMKKNFHYPRHYNHMEECQLHLTT